LLAFRGATDRYGLPVVGHPDVSAAVCVGTILMVSMPALWLILRVLQTGAAARPGIAGALVRLLSGALGAAAYTLGCTNAGLFVAFWYSAAILIKTGLGAAIGRRVLAW
jgi:hypothetical protein